MPANVEEDVQRIIADFCGNVRRLRQEHGLTRREMGDIMGVGLRTVRRLERGEVPARFSLESMWRLAKHFGLRAEQVLAPLPGKEDP